MLEGPGSQLAPDENKGRESSEGHGQEARPEKLRIRCPLPGHEDSSFSAVIFLRTQRFHCSVCTPGSSLPVSKIQHRLEDLARALGEASPLTSLPRKKEFSSNTQDERTWEKPWLAASARARDDRFADDPEDREVWDFLHNRNLSEAFELAELGILARDQELPGELRSWLERGYRIVLPLRSIEDGRIVGLQARSIRSAAKPKALTTSRTRLNAAAFLNARARRALFEDGPGARACEAALPAAVDFTPGVFLLAEGLTDHLALSIHAPCPVISVPGAQLAAGVVSHWVEGQALLLALDDDEAGHRGAKDAGRRASLHGARHVGRLPWPEGAKDACETLAQVGEEAFGAGLEGFVEEAREMARRAPPVASRLWRGRRES